MRKIISFCILSILFWYRIVFAETPGIKITQPQDGTTVTPGQEITVTVEAVGGFVLKEGWIAIGRIEQVFTVLPTTVIFTIPNKAAGKVILDVLGKDVSGKFAGDEITLIVQQTATLQFLEIDQDKIYVDLDWDGNIKGDRSGNIVTIYGIYSDGIKRILDDDPNTTYTSSVPSVISIDNTGKFQIHKVGEASITVSNSGVSKTIPVVFKPPRGIRPSETIPPTTQIDIQPPVNSAGWNNSDITATLTAIDNEGGSGVQEIHYFGRGISSKEEIVQGNTAQIIITPEGIYELVYLCWDNEFNKESPHFMKLRLDKTPPSITSTITPGPNTSGWHNSDVTVSFTAQDNLSGIKGVTPTRTISTEGADQSITGEAIDLADNKSTTSVTINLDKTPPAIPLELKPINLSNKEKNKGKEEDEGNWYELLYSATDNLSGLKSLNAGLIILSLTNYKIELDQDDELNITIDEEEKEIEIKSPDPQQILTQLQSGLLTLNNTQILQLKIKQGEPKWKIKEKDNKGLEIQAPSIILKATASDYADNIATKELEFKKEKRKDNKD